MNDSNAEAQRRESNIVSQWIPWLVVIALAGITSVLWQPISILLSSGDEAALAAARERGDAGLTQFGEVMERLGVRMIRAHSPQAKGRVERSFRTLQDRLIKELADEGITAITAANRYLRGTFMAAYNRRFGVEAADATSAFVKPNPPLDYNAVFCLRETRQVRNDYTIPWKGERLHLLGSHGLRSGSRVEVRRWLDGSVHVYFKDEKVRTRRLPKRAS